MTPVGQRSVFYWHDHLEALSVCVCVCVCVCVRARAHALVYVCLHRGWRMYLAILEP